MYSKDKSIMVLKPVMQKLDHMFSTVTPDMRWKRPGLKDDGFRTKILKSTETPS